MDLLLRAPITYMPHLKNRFVIEFPTELGIEVWMAISCDTPKLTINPVEMQFINTSTWVQGRYTWNQMNITLRDFIGPSTLQALMGWIRLGVESISGRMGYAASVAKTLTLSKLDPTGVKVSSWLLENCIPVATIDFGGTHSYTDDGVVELSFSFQPQKCILLF